LKAQRWTARQGSAAIIGAAGRAQSAGPRAAALTWPASALTRLPRPARGFFSPLGPGGASAPSSEPSGLLLLAAAASADAPLTRSEKADTGPDAPSPPPAPLLTSEPMRPSALVRLTGLAPLGTISGGSLAFSPSTTDWKPFLPSGLSASTRLLMSVRLSFPRCGTWMLVDPIVAGAWQSQIDQSLATYPPVADRRPSAVSVLSEGVTSRQG
jgi:hypothetical protein